MNGIVPRLTQIDAVKVINSLLESLKNSGCNILDWENPDMALDHIEYHAADAQIRGGLIKPGAGDKTDNLYCYFKRVDEEG